ncbi:MAG: caspase family protein [Bacteroidota bacterium]
MSDPRSLNLPDPTDSAEKPLGRTNYLLAIGIDTYEHVGKLSNAVRDAREVIDALTQHYSFDPEHVYTLFNGEATEDGIIAIFKEMRPKMQSTDNLLIYFSGHGHYEADIDEGYWVPVDARYGRTNDYISYSFLLKVIKSLKVHHLVLLVDSCYSGAIFVSERSISEERADFSRLDRDPSRWVMASGRNEVVPDGVSGDNSPFAKELIDTLLRYKQEGIRMSSLVNKVVTATIHNSVQTPLGRPIFGVGDKGGEFVFYPKGATHIPNPPSIEFDPPKPLPQPDTPEGRVPSSVGSFIPWLVAGILLVSLVLVWVFSRNTGPSVREQEPAEVEVVEEVAQPERTPERDTDKEEVIPMSGRTIIAQIQSARSGMSARQLRDFHELERLRQTAVPSLIKLADGGSAWAACRLGMKYLSADEYGKANEWFERSARQGNPYGQLFLGIMHKEGLGRSKDMAMARKLLEMSSEQNNPIAKQMLEEMGEGNG